MAEFNVNDKVVVRDKMANGRNTLVRKGTILAFKDEKREVAVVAIASGSPRAPRSNNGGPFQDFNSVRREIRVSDLQKDQARLSPGANSRVR